MEKFVATLTGESDGYVISREFADLARAKAWLQGAGLSEFEDQMASGEVSLDGRIIWTKSHLQTSEKAEKNDKLEAHRFLARLGFTPKER